MKSATLILAACLFLIVAASITTAQPQGYFTDVTPVLADPSFSDFVVAPSTDELTLFFSNFGGRGGEGGEDMWMATRTDLNSAFENVVNLGPTVNSPENDDVGSVSADGLTLYFGSNRAGNWDMYQATRGNTTQPFDNVTSLGPGVNTSIVENNPRLTPDGLQMVYMSNAQPEIWMATRNSVAQPFGNATFVRATTNEDWWPSISADGLTLFISDWVFAPPRPGAVGDSIDIWVSTRATVNDPFGPVVNLNDMWPGSNINTPFVDGSPYITPDWPAPGSRLYFISNSLTGQLVADVFQATWVPEPSSIMLLLIGLIGLTRYWLTK